MIKEATDDEEEDRLNSHSHQQLRFILRGNHEKNSCNAFNIQENNNGSSKFEESSSSNISKSFKYLSDKENINFLETTSKGLI